MRLKILLSAVLAGLLTASACAQSAPLAPDPGPWMFSGTVLRMDGDRIGAPIAGAQLHVVSGVNLNAHVTSNATGRFVFDALEGGRFIVSIGAPGYVSTTPIVVLFRDTEANFALAPE